MNKPTYTHKLDLSGIELDQVYRSPLGLRCKVVAIETSGYCIVRNVGFGGVLTTKTTRLWCDILASWKVVEG